MKTLPLLLMAILLTFFGCNEKSDESNDSMDNNFTVIKGTVPGTLIQAYCSDNRLYSTNSIDNGTTQHPFSLEVPKDSDCSLEMVTNEDKPNQSVTVSILFKSDEINSTILHVDVKSIDLGYVDLPMSRDAIVDEDKNGVSDEPFIVEVPQNVLPSLSLSSESVASQVTIVFSSSSLAHSSSSPTPSSSAVSSTISLSSSLISQSSSSFSSSLTLSNSSSSAFSSLVSTFASSSTTSSLSSSSQATYEEYNASKIYEAGDRVMYQGVVFEAKWWVQGEIPTDEAGSGAWKRITPYDSYPQYSSEQIYNVGDRVYYQGLLYEAKWWTQGDIPDSSLADGPWKEVSE